MYSGGRSHSAAWGLDRTFYELLGIRDKKRDILQMLLRAKTFSCTSLLEKILEENFINSGKYG